MPAQKRVGTKLMTLKCQVIVRAKIWFTDRIVKILLMGLKMALGGSFMIPRNSSFCLTVIKLPSEIGIYYKIDDSIEVDIYPRHITLKADPGILWFWCNVNRKVFSLKYRRFENT